MTVDTILRLFCITVGVIIIVILAVSSLILGAKEFARNPWGLSMSTFLGAFTLAFAFGATEVLFFISPTDVWVEIITEAIAISLMVTVVQVIGWGVYFRWRKGKK